MGYGPGLYRFMLDPFAQMKSSVFLSLVVNLIIRI